jgi:hypothetical protein
MLEGTKIFHKKLPIKANYILFCLLFWAHSVYAQQEDTLRFNFELGKRGNVFFNRQISLYNLGGYSSPFSKIFYKESQKDYYKSVGFLGNKYIHFFKNNPLALKEFRKYKGYKIVSYFSLISVPIVAVAWVASASLYNRRAGLPRRRGPLNFFPTDTYYAFPISLAGLTIGSILCNQAAERHLLMATELLNNRMKPLKQRK